jgi:hypothetical protein
VLGSTSENANTVQAKERRYWGLVFCEELLILSCKECEERWRRRRITGARITRITAWMEGRAHGGRERDGPAGEEARVEAQ